MILKGLKGFPGLALACAHAHAQGTSIRKWVQLFKPFKIGSHKWGGDSLGVQVTMGGVTDG